MSPFSMRIQICLALPFLKNGEKTWIRAVLVQIVLDAAFFFVGDGYNRIKNSFEGLDRVLRDTFESARDIDASWRVLLYNVLSLCLFLLCHNCGNLGTGMLEREKV